MKTGNPSGASPDTGASGVVSTTTPNLFLLPTGNAVVDFVSLLLSDECTHVMTSLKERFQFVIVNSPPITRYPESAVIASRSDGAVIALTVGKRTRSEVSEIKRALNGLKVPILGAVLCKNQLEASVSRE